MSYYQFNRQELLQKAKNRYHNCGGKEKAAEFYIQNKEVIKANAANNYRNLSEEEKEAKREYGRNGYRNMIKKNQAKTLFFLYNIK